MTKKRSFTAIIQNAGGGGAFVEVPFDVEAVFGAKKPKVKATIEGIHYRGVLTRMGTECHLLIVLKSIREQAGKAFGDEIKVTVELDTEPRVVEIPSELKKALAKDRNAKASFEKLSYTHRREYAMYVAEAKKEKTRILRAAKTIEMLKQEKKAR
ncbi:MAG: DUF1905 domain-containing protein [Chloroflexi bacterium]|nr:DUF1905 domain-containing protein [Chloroflexota bacterium]